MENIVCVLHSLNGVRLTIQSFIYKKRLVCIPHTTQNVWVEIHKSLLSFNGVRSYFLTDEDLSVRLILGDRCFHKYSIAK